jgi:DNA-binding HxlR family transcriptional regulator
MPLSTIGRALAELADSWTLLILQRAFLGVRRFAGWRDELGISESVLAGRLRDMTTAGLLEALAAAADALGYWLTPGSTSGRCWRSGLGAGVGAAQVPLACGTAATCGRSLGSPRRRPRLVRPSRVRCLVHPRGASARPLSTPGASATGPDRAGGGRQFLGVRSFAEFSRELSVSPDVLSDRLRRFVTLGILTTEPGGYRLTDKGRATFPIMALVVAWAERWLGPEGHPSALRIVHQGCGAELDPRLACVPCGELLERTAVRFVTVGRR